MVKHCYIGIDVGSVSTNVVLTDQHDNLIDKVYLRTNGRPINAICEALDIVYRKFGNNIKVYGVGSTGSGRKLADAIIGADIVKNEITVHAIAAQKLMPGVNTILEIGGQDSKIIILRDGIVYDFAMNTVCAAGTGSFLDRQAARLQVPIQEFGEYALRADNPVRIAGRCAVFAESDMIHKQQTGHTVENIVAGLCEALVRNYLSNLAKGKDLKPPIVFQGGVAANIGIVKAFEKTLNTEVLIPKYYDVMGAYGAAIAARSNIKGLKGKSKFCGFEALKGDYAAKSFECDGCSNICVVIEILSGDNIVACWGDRCGKWAGRTEENIHHQTDIV